MKAVGIIPARWASTRFAGKVLADIAGKPLIRHVWERALKSCRLERVFIACDEEHVLKAVVEFGAEAVMTGKEHASGSDRVAEVAAGIDADIIVNIQGDEPLIDPALVDDLVTALAQDKEAVMATAARRVRSFEEFQNPNVVKLVKDKKGNALYFSRAMIPFKRDGKIMDLSGYFAHLGIYAYRRDFLLEFCRWPRSFLEEQESLEQLRVLEAGCRIKVVETMSAGVAVDTPEDLARMNAYFKGLN